MQGVALGDEQGQQNHGCDADTQSQHNDDGEVLQEKLGSDVASSEQDICQDEQQPGRGLSDRLARGHTKLLTGHELP